eukprot:2142902-Rhodomonas_salina.1
MTLQNNHPHPEEVCDVAMQAISDQCTTAMSGSKCWNCGGKIREIWGAEGARQADFTLLDCRVEFTPGVEGAGLEQEGLEPEGLVVDLEEQEGLLAT